MKTDRKRSSNFWSELFQRRPDLSPPGYDEAVADLKKLKETPVFQEVQSQKYPINTKVLVMDLKTGEWEGPYSVKSAINEKGLIKVSSRHLKSTIMVSESQLRIYVT